MQSSSFVTDAKCEQIFRSISCFLVIATWISVGKSVNCLVVPFCLRLNISIPSSRRNPEQRHQLRGQIGQVRQARDKVGEHGAPRGDGRYNPQQENRGSYPCSRTAGKASFTPSDCESDITKREASNRTTHPLLLSFLGDEGMRMEAQDPIFPNFSSWVGELAPVPLHHGIGIPVM